MEEVKETYSNHTNSVNSFSSDYSMEGDRVPGKSHSFIPYFLVAVAFIALSIALALLSDAYDKKIDEQGLLLYLGISAPLIMVFGGVILYFYNRRFSSKLARLEKNQREILAGFGADNFRTLRLAKVATRLEFEESKALDLEVMVARGGKLYEVGPDGGENLIGETENKPKSVTKRRFTIGD